jgi:hypothetical protein
MRRMFWKNLLDIEKSGSENEKVELQIFDLLKLK